MTLLVRLFLFLFAFLNLTGCSINAAIQSALSQLEKPGIRIEGDNPVPVGIGQETSVPLRGDCPEGAQSITVESPLNMVLSCVDGGFTGSIDVSHLPDDLYSLRLASDTGETFNWSVRKDTVAPTVSVVVSGSYINTENVNAYAITGNCSENGSFVFVEVGSIRIPLLCSGGTYSGVLDLRAISDGPVVIRAQHLDLVLNMAEAHVTRTKDTVMPGAITLQDAPTSPSPQVSLNISASGPEVVSYSYKLGTVDSIDCSSVSGYGGFRAISNNIVEDISSLPDAMLRLCVWGEDIAGNRTPLSSVTQYDWIKDSTMAIATVGGFIPAGTPSNVGGSRSVTVGGVSITHYKAVVVKDASCSSADFSLAAETSIVSDFSFSISGDGEYRVCAIGKNVAGNWQSESASTSSVSLFIDRISPSLNLTSVATDPLAASSFVVTATFSEVVTDFSLEDIVVANGVASAFSGSGSVYTFTITPTSQGLVTVSVVSGVAHDLAGNGNSAAMNLTRTYDSISPSLVLSSASAEPFNSAAFSVTANFSEDVSGFDLGDVSVTNGVASSLSGSGSSYAFLVTPLGQGTVTVEIGAGAAQDSAGNQSTAAVSLVRTYDSIPPTMTGLANDGVWRASKSWSWGCDETCTYRFVVDTNATTTPSGAYGSLTSTSQSSGSGTFYLHVQALDSAGNTTLVHVSALLDNTVPSSVASLADGITLNSLSESPIVTFTNGTDAHCGILKHQLRVLRSSDSFVIKDWHDFTSGDFVTGLSLVSDEIYRVEVKAVDNLGLESTIVTSDGWVADTTAPTAPTGLTLGAVPTVTTTSPPLSWSAASDGSGSGVAYYQAQIYRSSDHVSMSSWTTISSGGSISGLSLTDGVSYYFKVRAVDSAGNTGAVSGASGSWTAVLGFTFNYTISANTLNFNLRAAAIAAGWNQSVPVFATITINPGVYVWSDSTSLPAFDTGTLSAGSTVVIINKGVIMGKGGNGADLFTAGGAGGNALSISLAISLDNSAGYVAGGGGGGGGLAYTDGGSWYVYIGGGGGAGGGAGGRYQAATYDGPAYSAGGVGGGVGASGGAGPVNPV